VKSRFARPVLFALLMVLASVLAVSAHHSPDHPYYWCEVNQTWNSNQTYHHDWNGQHCHHGVGYGHYPDSGVYWTDVPAAIIKESNRLKLWMVGWSGIHLDNNNQPLMWPLPEWAQSPGQPPLTYHYYAGQQQLTYFPGMPAWLGLQARKSVGRVWERMWDFGTQGVRYATTAGTVGLKGFAQVCQAGAAYASDLPSYWFWRVLAESVYGCYVIIDQTAELLPDITMADYIPVLSLENPILKACDFFLPLTEIVNFFVLCGLVFVCYVGLGLFTRAAKVLR
jgi:hypothetical protein